MLQNRPEKKALRKRVTLTVKKIRASDPLAAFTGQLSVTDGTWEVRMAVSCAFLALAQDQMGHLMPPTEGQAACHHPYGVACWLHTGTYLQETCTDCGSALASQCLR